MSTVALCVKVSSWRALHARRAGYTVEYAVVDCAAEVVVAILDASRPARSDNHVEAAADVPAVVAGAAFLDAVLTECRGTNNGNAVFALNWNDELA